MDDGCECDGCECDACECDGWGLDGGSRCRGVVGRGRKACRAGEETKNEEGGGGWSRREQECPRHTRSYGEAARGGGRGGVFGEGVGLGIWGGQAVGRQRSI